MLRKNRWIARMAVLLTVLALAGALIVIPVSAQMLQLPHSFYGTVEINGKSAPLGTQIEARCSGVSAPEDGNPIMVSKAGYYGSGSATGAKLVVQGADIPDNADITFYVNGHPADQTFLWKSGEITELNLTVDISEETSGGGGGGGGSSDEDEETPTPTPTPISAPSEPEGEELTTVITPAPVPPTTPTPSPAPAKPAPKPTTNPAPAPAPEETEQQPEPTEEAPVDGESFFDTLNWYWVGGIILVGIIIIMLFVVTSAKRF